MNDKIKRELRIKTKNERRCISKNEKDQLDKAILGNFVKSRLISDIGLVMIYLSSEIEVDTKGIIKYCLDNSINVAVPKCVGTRKMDFYYYNESTILEKSKFGIYEPLADEKNLVKSFENALCIVPGLLFDNKGYRLGYGGGFYDTLIYANPDLITVGICYERHVFKSLPLGEYDKNVNYIITEKSVNNCNE
ncbi:MAG: 5-formyltetrahydrofolate cyclo-ligase [Ruminococcus sp.]|nr:5-formyltetrahydrofolate cyclo-ligase [Ruminococcus sp.]